MKIIYGAIVATAFAAAAFPAWSEPNPPKPGIPDQSSQPTVPSPGVSKPGTPGLAGSKSGPAPAVTVGEGAATRKPGGIEPNVSPDATGSATSEITKQQDMSGVPGLPGSKSGPAVRPPSN